MTINFPWRDDMFSARGRYIFPWRTVLLPRLDAKISLRGRQFFLGGTIRSRPKISQKRRYSFPRRTIFCCVPAQELRVRVSGVPITPRIFSQARRYAPRGGRWAVGEALLFASETIWGPLVTNASQRGRCFLHVRWSLFSLITIAA
jgi:hypothetical protein